MRCVLLDDGFCCCRWLLMAVCSYLCWWWLCSVLCVGCGFVFLRVFVDRRVLFGVLSFGVCCLMFGVLRGAWCVMSVDCCLLC